MKTDTGGNFRQFKQVGLDLLTQCVCIGECIEYVLGVGTEKSARETLSQLLVLALLSFSTQFAITAGGEWLYMRPHPSGNLHIANVYQSVADIFLVILQITCSHLQNSYNHTKPLLFQFVHRASFQLSLSNEAHTHIQLSKGWQNKVLFLTTSRKMDFPIRL